MKDLLSPRFKVIADYPENKDFPVGKIIEFVAWNNIYFQHVVKDCQGDRMWLSRFFENYPHLFKPLPWHEDREPGDMPEYVKHKGSDGIFKVALHFTGMFYSDSGDWPYHHDADIFILDDDRFVTDRVDRQYYDFLPATLEDYNNYINSKA